MEHDKEKCMCDECIKYRVKRKVAEREFFEELTPYERRRGGAVPGPRSEKVH